MLRTIEVVEAEEAARLRVISAGASRARVTCATDVPTASWATRAATPDCPLSKLLRRELQLSTPRAASTTGCTTRHSSACSQASSSTPSGSTPSATPAPSTTPTTPTTPSTSSAAIAPSPPTTSTTSPLPPLPLPLFFVLQVFGAANGVKEVEIAKEGSDKWMPMKRKDGAVWEQTSAKHIMESGSRVSVRVTSTKGKKVVLKGVIESGWRGRDIYNSQTNF
ncbi:unnamed protein product [Closterium sp. NIES-53]